MFTLPCHVSLCGWRDHNTVFRIKLSTDQVNRINDHIFALKQNLHAVFTTAESLLAGDEVKRSVKIEQAQTCVSEEVGEVSEERARKLEECAVRVEAKVTVLLKEVHFVDAGQSMATDLLLLFSEQSLQRALVV